MNPFSYAAAGVDLSLAAQLKGVIKELAALTHGPQVLAGVGPFAGLFKLEGYQNPVLAASADGVGTKIKIACLLDRHDSIGKDLVHHCVNDILTLGARPLFLLDYLAMGKLAPERVTAIIRGISQACADLGIVLLGGETAEMPGVYAPGDYDLVGFIIGVVEQEGIISGKTIAAGDVLIALPSSGVHTNGFSLIRKVFRVEEQPQILNRYFPELRRPLGEELLEPHRCYLPELEPLLARIKGMAHITGGGIRENLARVLPPGIGARIRKNSWEIPPIFELVRREGNIEEEEMYRVFNMGVGMILIVSRQSVAQILSSLSDAKIIGETIAGEGVILE